MVGNIKAVKTQNLLDMLEREFPNQLLSPLKTVQANRGQNCHWRKSNPTYFVSKNNQVD